MKIVLSALTILTLSLPLIGCAGDADPSEGEGQINRELASSDDARTDGKPSEYHVVTLDDEGQPIKDDVVGEEEFTRNRDEATINAQQDLAGVDTDPYETADIMEPMINRVSDQACRDRRDFFKLWNNTTIARGVCFANNGTTNIRVFKVFQVNTGNNAGHFVGKFSASGSSFRFPAAGRELCPRVAVTFRRGGRAVALHTVSQVSIVGRTGPGC